MTDTDNIIPTDIGLGAAFAEGNTTTKADLFSRAKNAIEAGEQSLHEAAEALALAQDDFRASQREIADFAGKSVAWVNRLLQWRRQGFVDTPFGPGSKAGRERRKHVQSTEQGAPRKVVADNPEVSSEKCKTECAKREAGPKSQAGDEAMRAFTVLVMELSRRTAKRPPQHFSATAVPVDVLARLGSLLTDIANLKESEAVKPEPTMALSDKGTVSVGQP
jgi:hypothetical protein